MSAPESAVRVEFPTGERTDTLLDEEVFPLRMPNGKLGGESFPVAVFEIEHKHPQFLSGLQLGIFGDVPRDGFELMEDAKLNRESPCQALHQAFLAIADHSKNSVATVLEFVDTTEVIDYRFVRYEVPK